MLLLADFSIGVDLFPRQELDVVADFKPDDVDGAMESVFWCLWCTDLRFRSSSGDGTEDSEEEFGQFSFRCFFDFLESGGFLATVFHSVVAGRWLLRVIARAKSYLFVEIPKNE